MKKRKLFLPRIFDSINKFNESIAKNVEGKDFANFSLRYCVQTDTLHSFEGEECYNCNFETSPSVLISRISDFGDYYGDGAPYKLVNLIDNWIEKNNFPSVN